MHPRNDFVLVEMKQVGETGAGVALPAGCMEGKLFFVKAIGPKVEGLKVGDRVLMMGRFQDTYWDIPGQRNLIITKQDSVALVFEDGE